MNGIILAVLNFFFLLLSWLICTEESEIAGPSDIIMRRGTQENTEETDDSDTDDIDHTGKNDLLVKSQGLVLSSLKYNPLIHPN